MHTAGVGDEKERLPALAVNAATASISRSVTPEIEANTWAKAAEKGDVKSQYNIAVMSLWNIKQARWKK